MSLMKSKKSIHSNSSNKEHSEDFSSIYKAKSLIGENLNVLGKWWIKGYSEASYMSRTYPYSLSDIFGDLPYFDKFRDMDDYGPFEKFITFSKSTRNKKSTALNENSSKTNHTNCFVEIAAFTHSDEFLSLPPESRAYILGAAAANYDAIVGDRANGVEILKRIPKEYKK